MITTMTNVDYLIDDVRMRLGDFDGTGYSEALIRTSLINSVRFLSKRWRAKYQIFNSGLIAGEQPAGAADQGYFWTSTVNGYAFLPMTYNDNDIFRNPFLEFEQPSPPIIEQDDEEAFILCAMYLVHLAKLTSSSSTFVSWSTEDLRYTNTEASKSMNHVLDHLLAEIDTLFKTKIAQPRATRQPLNIIIGTKVF
jgi:hypothetical protein